MADHSIPIKVLHLRSSPFVGSPEKLILNRLKVMNNNFCQYTLAIFDEQPGATNDFLQEAQELHCRTLKLQDSLLFFIPNMIKLCREIYRQKLKIICAHDYKSNLYGLLAGKLVNIPALAIFHGRTRTDRKSRFYEACDNYLLPYFDALICVSEYTRELLRRTIPSPPPIFVIPNAVPFESAHNTDLPAKPGGNTLKDKRKKAVFAGRLCSEKGIFDLVEAAKKILTLRNDITFLILGDGPEMKHLEKNIKESGLKDFIQVLGFTNTISQYYEAMDFLILPSLAESMPMAILESFSLRKPVIATAVGGIPEIVQHTISGLLVQPGDVDALAQAIYSLLDDPRKTLEMGNKGYAQVKAHHTVEAQVAKYLSVYEQVIKRSFTAPGEKSQ